jgi:hypothetical protein
VNLKRTFISFLTATFGFLVLVYPAFGYGVDKDRSFAFNQNLPDSALNLRAPLSQNYLLSSGLLMHEDTWEYSDNILIPKPQDWPQFDQRVSFLRQDDSRRRTFPSSIEKRRIDYRRASLIGGLNVGAITAGFYEAINTWGQSKGKFHLKDDWKGDGLAQTDELSHFMWGYKMTQFLYWAYEWAGFSSTTSRTLSVCQSSLILTLVEYPIDAYNPKQGLGVSDLVFDYLGVGLAVAKKHSSWLNDFDFKISWKKNIFSENQTVFAQTYEEFDNFIYWLTYRTKLFFPKKLACFGIGYSATRSGFKPERQIYAGIGLSIPDFASLFGRRVGDACKPLEILYPSIRIKL